MRPSEFCYWLQGYFELRSEDTPLTKDQWVMVLNHINLVKKVKEYEADPLRSLLATAPADSTISFVNWLIGTLEAAFTPELKVDLAGVTPLVKRKLAEQFEHVIDKSYGIDPAELHKIHSPATSSEGKKSPERRAYRPSDHYPPTGGSGGTSFNC